MKTTINLFSTHDSAQVPSLPKAESWRGLPQSGGHKGKFPSVPIACLAVVFLSVMATSAHAGILAYEGFNYAPGNQFGLSSPATTATGFSGNFHFFGEDLTIAPNASQIVAGSLGYTDGASQVLATSANHYENGHGRLSETFNTSGGGPFASYLEGSNIGANGKTLYLSVAYKLGALTGTGYGAFELFRGSDTDPNRILSLNTFAGHPSGNLFLDVGEGANSGTFGGSPSKESDLGFVNTNTNFFVFRFDFGTGGTDTVSVYANPLLGSEPVSPIAQVSASDLSFDRIANSTFSGGPAQSIDEIRVGTSYASVTGVPEPGTAFVGVLLLGVAAARRRRR